MSHFKVYLQKMRENSQYNQCRTFYLILTPCNKGTCRQMRNIQKQKHLSTCPGHSPLLHFVVLLLILLAAPQTTSAMDTYSITSDSEVPVRSGQGTEYRTVALLKNGDLISSLEEVGYWVKIRTATGKEGWVLKRYLSTATTPSTGDTVALPVDNNQANKPLKITPPPLTDPLQHSSQSASSEIPAEKLQSSPSANPVSHINPTQGEREKELTELRNNLAALTQENQELKDHEKTIWFLAGGGVFLVGWLFGLISAKARKRKPSLL